MFFASSFCKGDIILKPKKYLDRNKSIVDKTDILIAFPSTNEEVIRSGTWSTIRYAKNKGKKILLLRVSDKIKEGEIIDVNQ